MERRLFRSRTNRRLSGVCGGLGEYLDVDPTLVRLIFLLLLIFTGIVPGLIFYLAAWVIMPEEAGSKTT